MVEVYNDLRAVYTPKGLRWASDYDAKRVRLSLIQNSYNVHFGGGITLKRSGFWTVQVLYSHDVVIDGVTIRNNEGGRGPIDRRHRYRLLARDLMSPTPTSTPTTTRCASRAAATPMACASTVRPRTSMIHDSIIRRGAAAITIGSETSGGFHNIEVWNLTAEAGAGNRECCSRAPTPAAERPRTSASTTSRSPASLLPSR